MKNHKKINAERKTKLGLGPRKKPAPSKPAETPPAAVKTPAKKKMKKDGKPKV